MKVAYILTAIAQVASAHYFFDTNIINGVADKKYMRTTTRKTWYNPIKFSSNPAVDIRDGSFVDGPDIRCNQGAFSSAGKTEVMSVTAGSEVRFRLGVGATMAHPGPGLVYMSRAPSDNVKAYDGSGDWFKIFQEGVCDTAGDWTNKAWCTWDRNWIAATIPKNTPNGEYLVRVEHIGVHRSHVNQPEHFTSCMQVKVTGGGNGVPGPLVKFPGAYKNTDPYANFSVYNKPKTFSFPGPAVWDGAGSSVQVTTTKSAASSPQPTTTMSTMIIVKPTTTMSTMIIVKPTTTMSSMIIVKPTTTMSSMIIVKPTTTMSSMIIVQPTTDCEASAAAGVPLYGQCGGIGFAGPNVCAKGKCVAANKWYSQCL